MKKSLLIVLIKTQYEYGQGQQGVYKGVETLQAHFDHLWRTVDGWKDLPDYRSLDTFFLRYKFDISESSNSTHPFNLVTDDLVIPLTELDHTYIRMLRSVYELTNPEVRVHEKLGFISLILKDKPEKYTRTYNMLNFGRLTNQKAGKAVHKNHDYENLAVLVSKFLIAH